MNEYTIQEINVGMEASFDRTITEDMMDSFRCITGDDNPLHKEDDFAQAVSEGKVRKHAAFGMLTASFCSTMAGMYLPGRYSLIHSIEELSFLKPVFVGDTLTITGTVIDKNDALRLIVLKILIKNQDGKSVVRARMKVLVLK